MAEQFRRVIRCDAGQNLVEYSLLLALIVLMAIAGLQLVGVSLTATFGGTSAALSGSPGSGSGGGGGNSADGAAGGNAGSGSAGSAGGSGASSGAGGSGGGDGSGGGSGAGGSGGSDDDDAGELGPPPEP
jgi:Flp pilus assembly pilin Flp